MTLLDVWMPLLAVFIVGLCVGSFINVVIHRLPLMMQQEWEQQAQELMQQQAPATPVTDATPETLTLSKPASSCPRCGHKIRWHENIPLLSFVMLRGQCSHCKGPISLRYPMIELLAALLAVLVFLRWGYQHNSIDFNPHAIAVTGAIWLLLTMAMIDLDTQLLPDTLTYLLLWTGLLYHAVFHPALLPESVLAAAIGYSFFWSVYQLFKLFTGREGMGYGDFKLLAGLGAWLGLFCLVPVILIASVTGIVYALTLRAKAPSPDGLSQPFAFGPFLALGGGISLYLGPQTMLALFN